MEELERRRVLTRDRIHQLNVRLAGAQEIVGSTACVYATGSTGRGEASEHSDLDAFILAADPSQSGAGSSLTKLDEIRLKARLIEANRQAGIPDFDGDGRYLVRYSPKELVTSIGKPEDDSSNTFTARLLLLLESAPLVGDEFYREAKDDVLSAYFRDFPDHSANFAPAYLSNDILRLWRTFCVNYEARTTSATDEKKAKRKYKNYKLKFSRMLTCYSAILQLLCIYNENQTVTVEDGKLTINKSPTERLEWLVWRDISPEAKKAVLILLELYDEFLALTVRPESDMVADFMDTTVSAKYFKAGDEFGKAMFTAVNTIGAGSRFHRLIVV